MEITMYLDVVILVNFCMDYFLLWLLKMILKLKGSRVRRILGGAAGAAGSALAQWALLYRYGPAGGGAAACFLWLGAVTGVGSLMLLCAFPFSGFSEFWKAEAGLFFGAALTEGILEAALQVWDSIFRPAAEGFEGGHPGTVPLLFLLAGSGLTADALWQAMCRSWKERSCHYQVTLFHQGRQVRAEGFLDTGNRLQEPVSGRPVHVADRALLEAVCPTVDKICLIPYRTIDGGGSSLKAVALDRMEAVQGKRRLVYDHPLVAASPGKLQMKNGCQVLLHE